MSSCVLHLPMDESSGSIAYDYSGYNNSGSLYSQNNGSISGATFVIDAEKGEVLQFDSDADAVTVVHSDVITFANSFSISLWIKTTQTPASWTSILSKIGSKVNYSINLNPSGTIQFEIYDGTNNPQQTSTSIVNDGTWHNIIAIRNIDDDKLYLYIDNILQGSGATDTTTEPIIDTGNVRIGELGAVEYIGSVSKISLLNRVITSAERATLYAGGQVASGLVAEWLCHNTAGATVLEDTHNRVAGKYGNAGNFDGIIDNIVIADNETLDLDSSFAISLWFNTSYVPVGWSSIIRKSGDGVVNYGFNLYPSGIIQFEIWDGTFNPVQYSLLPKNDGLWHHLVGVRNVVDDKIYLYVDGILQGNGGVDITESTIVNSAILYLANGGSVFKGIIDEVRIYNRALTAEEISLLYSFNSERVVTGQGLLSFS